MSAMMTSITLPLPGWLGAIVEASLYATVVAALVVVVQGVLGRRMSARWRFALWFLVLARLVPLPLPESRVSVFNLLGPSAATAPESTEALLAVVPETALRGMSETADGTVVDPTSGAPVPALSAEPVSSAGSLNEAAAAWAVPVQPQSRVFPWSSVLVATYLAGAGLVLMRQVLATRALGRIMRAGRAPTDPRLRAGLDEARRTLGITRPVPLLLVEALSSPAIVGFVRPKLLLPAHLAETLPLQDLQHICLHECAHLRRRDVPLNYLIALLTALHWFNPLMYVLLPRLRADRELATDELVLTHTEPALYGQTLLAVFQAGAIPCRAPASVAITETRSFFKRRIHMIARYQKRPAWLTVPAVLSMVVVGACTLTGPLTGAVETARAAAPAQAATPAQAPAPAQPAATPAAAADPVQGASAAKTGATFTEVYESPAQAAAERANQATRAKLEKKIQELTASDQPLEKVLQFLQDQAGVSMHVAWRPLEQAGIRRDVNVTVRLGEVPLRRALTVVLREAGGNNERLGYTVEDGVVTVTTLDALRGPEFTRSRVYNVRPFLSPDRDAKEQADELVGIILGGVEPDSWRDNGGTVGDIREFNGLLTIKTSSDLHQQISELLGTIAQAHAATPPMKAAGAARKQGASAPPAAAIPQDGGTGVEQELRQLKMSLLALEQDRAVLESRGGHSMADMKALDVRMAKIREQIAERATQSLERAHEDEQRRTHKAAQAQAELRTQIYSAAFLFGKDGAAPATLTADQRAAVDDLARAVRSLLRENESASAVNGTVMVQASRHTQARVEQFLGEYRATFDQMNEQRAKQAAAGKP